MEAPGPVVVLAAVGGLSVVLDAAGGRLVALLAVWNGTRSPAACSARWTLVFDRRWRLIMLEIEMD